MKWVLVLIVLQGVDPVVEQGGVYDSIMECFNVREHFMEKNKGVQPAQAVCIRTADIDQ